MVTEGKNHEIKKIENKINLEDNVVAENSYKCHHDCIEYYYAGRTASKGCKQKHKVTARTSTHL